MQSLLVCLLVCVASASVVVFLCASLSLHFETVPMLTLVVFECAPLSLSGLSRWAGADSYYPQGDVRQKTKCHRHAGMKK